MRGDRAPVVSPEPPRPAPAAASPAAAPVAPRVVPPAAPMTPPPMPRPPKPAATPLAGVPSLLPVPAPPSAVEPPKRYATAASANGPSTWKTTPVTAAAAAAATPGPDLLAVPSGMFQGSLEVMDLAELTQAIGQGGKSGRLILALGRGSGLIVFDAGRIVHAEFRSTVGEEAFATLLAASHSEGGGRFCFVPATGGTPAARPRTIDKSVEQLLLSTATAIDEKG
jgi:hypothetical protein